MIGCCMFAEGDPAAAAPPPLHTRPGNLLDLTRRRDTDPKPPTLPLFNYFFPLSVIISFNSNGRKRLPRSYQFPHFLCPCPSLSLCLILAQIENDDVF